MPKSQLDWIGVICLWIGAVVMAIKAGDLPLASGAPDWLAGHFWNHIPLALLTIYLCVALYRLTRPVGETAAKYSNLPLPPSIQAVHSENVVPKDHSPELLPESVVREFLDLMLSDPTELQVRRFLQPYAGLWMELNLTLIGLAMSDNMLRAQLVHRDENRRSSSIWANFDTKWEHHLHEIKTGAALHFRGSVRLRDNRDPDFVDAILLPPLNPTSPPA